MATAPLYAAPIIKTPPQWIAKILKVPVYRMSLGNDLTSRIIIAVYRFFSAVGNFFTCKKNHFRPFDATKAQTSVERFEALGAQVEMVTPSTGKGHIQMMSFRAQDLEGKIKDLGGTWERRIVNGREVFAIDPQRPETQGWAEFKAKLSHFKSWKEEGGVIITSECADKIPENAPTQCFLCAHSTSGVFASEWFRAGFYIGAKQDFCFFDNGNTWKNSGRPPSEESFYEEIDTVYEKLQDKYNYPLSDMWVGGGCGAGPVAAYLKWRLHNQGINFFIEQSFADLDDFTRPISPFMAPWIKGSLKNNSRQVDGPDCPPACQFSPAQLWKDLEKNTEGKVIFVQVEKDEHIHEESYARYLKLCQTVNEKVHHIFFQAFPDSLWRHADDFFRHEENRSQFYGAVFDKAKDVAVEIAE